MVKIDPPKRILKAFEQVHDQVVKGDKEIYAFPINNYGEYSSLEIGRLHGIYNKHCDYNRKEELPNGVILGYDDKASIAVMNTLILGKKEHPWHLEKDLEDYRKALRDAVSKKYGKILVWKGIFLDWTHDYQVIEALIYNNSRNEYFDKVDEIIDEATKNEWKEDGIKVPINSSNDVTLRVYSVGNDEKKILLIPQSDAEKYYAIASGMKLDKNIFKEDFSLQEFLEAHSKVADLYTKPGDYEIEEYNFRPKDISSTLLKVALKRKGIKIKDFDFGYSKVFFGPVAATEEGREWFYQINEHVVVLLPHYAFKQPHNENDPLKKIERVYEKTARDASAKYDLGWIEYGVHPFQGSLYKGHGSYLSMLDGKRNQSGGAKWKKGLIPYPTINGTEINVDVYNKKTKIFIPSYGTSEAFIADSCPECYEKIKKQKRKR